MSTISAGNTTTTAFKVTADTTGNLTLAPNTGARVILTGPIQYADGTSANTAASGGGPGAFQAVQTANFTATANNIYAVNTTAATIYATLPASPTAGQYLTFIDYARTFSTNNLVLVGNGNKLEGSTINSAITTSGAAVSVIYADSVQGWLQYSGSATNIVGAYTVQMLLVAGGGSGGGDVAGGPGGGAGGVIYQSTVAVSPLTAYSIVIGAGATNGTTGAGSRGSNSTGFTYTAIGGGGGGGSNTSGGSGGGAYTTGGTGTAGQGNSGGISTSDGATYTTGGAGGGATATGGNASSSGGGNGGAGYTTSISGTSASYGGGGGGGGDSRGPRTNGTGGLGGGGNGTYGTGGGTGTANTGGGGGGSGYNGGTGGAGGSGICIVSYLGAQRGTGGTVTSSGGYTIHTFTTSGTFTA